MSEYSLLLDSPPQNWILVSFGELCARVKESAVPSSDGERLYLGLEHLASGFPILVGRGKESDVCSGKTAFSSGDVLFGKLRPYLRKSVLVKESGICSTDILVFRATEKCIPEFLCLLTHTDEFVGHAKATTSGVQHPRTSWSGLREFKLHVPPVSEQRKIIGILGVIQRSIEQQDRLISLTSELKSALMRKLFTEGLHGEKQKDTEIGLIPESWELKKLKECCEVVTSSFSYTQLSDFSVNSSENTIEVFGIKVSDMNIPGNETLINFSNLVKNIDIEIVKKKTVPQDTIVFPKRGAAIATNKKRLTKTWTVFDPNLIGVKAKKGLDTKFLFNWFLQFDLRKITDPGPTPQLNKKDLEPLLIPFPKDNSEQSEIGEYLEVVSQKIDHHNKKRIVLEELFRTLLHQLMTAEIRVNNLDFDELLVTEPA